MRSKNDRFCSLWRRTTKVDNRVDDDDDHDDDDDDDDAPCGRTTKKRPGCRDGSCHSRRQTHRLGLELKEDSADDDDATFVSIFDMVDVV